MDTEIMAYIGLVATACSIAGFWIGRKREARQEGAAEGGIRSDVEYIKRRSDDTLLEVKDINKSISNLSERVTRVEESSKQAHKRLDTIERQIINKEE